MTALRLLGHLPALGGCAACGQPIALAGRHPFALAAGGLLCPACRPGHRQVVSVTAATIQVLRQFAACDSDTWRDVTWDARTCGELRGVLNQYVCRLLDHRPRMHAYLGLLGHATR
jgi:DNA repair protein RecO (recombination protein O)